MIERCHCVVQQEIGLGGRYPVAAFEVKRRSRVDCICQQISFLKHRCAQQSLRQMPPVIIVAAVHLTKVIVKNLEQLFLSLTRKVFGLNIEVEDTA